MSELIEGQTPAEAALAVYRRAVQGWFDDATASTAAAVVLTLEELDELIQDANDAAAAAERY